MSRTYQQSGSYIPDTDWGVCQWLRNFSARIQESPGRFGLTSSDASILVNLYQQYRESFELVQDGSTRTPAAVTSKDAIKASALATARTYAGLIRANLGVDDGALVDLGMNARNTSRSPVRAPRTSPIIAVRAAFPCEHEMVYCDESTPASRRKPPGATILELHYHLLEPGTTLTRAMMDPQTAKHRMAVTRTPFMVKFKPEDAGKTVVYFARWSTAKGQMGPWSSPVYFTIAAGGPALDVIEEIEGTSKMKPSVDRDGDGDTPLKMAA